uniref:Uncharacterized protein n=1 Tax=Arundo donax TaxID=35708 RepID=A0A0A8ZWJ4_ARUDO
MINIIALSASLRGVSAANMAIITGNTSANKQLITEWQCPINFS